jgi:hypothetical protein
MAVIAVVKPPVIPETDDGAKVRLRVPVVTDPPVVFDAVDVAGCDVNPPDVGAGHPIGSHDAMGASGSHDDSRPFVGVAQVIAGVDLPVVLADVD